MNYILLDQLKREEWSSTSPSIVIILKITQEKFEDHMIFMVHSQQEFNQTLLKIIGKRTVTIGQPNATIRELHTSIAAEPAMKVELQWE